MLCPLLNALPYKWDLVQAMPKFTYLKDIKSFLERLSYTNLRKA